MAAEDERCKSLPLFSTMRIESFRRVMAHARQEDFPGGVLLMREGEPAERIYVLIKGQVELTAAWQRRDSVLAIEGPGAAFILASAVLGAPALMSARTLESSALLIVEAKAVRAAMASDPAFAASTARTIARDYNVMVASLKQQKLRSSMERLAHYLIALRESESAGENGGLILRHEKRVLASLLGMTPENLSRAFAALRAYGVIVQGAVVTLSDPAALAPLASSHLLTDA